MRFRTSFSLLFFLPVLFFGCAGNEKKAEDFPVEKLEPAQAQQMARQIESSVSPELAEGLTIKVWGVDSLVADPVSIDIDDQGALYYTSIRRMTNSEFDIRSHQDWEIASIKLRNIEDKREFLHTVLATEKSKENEWLEDSNQDSVHDWHDMTVVKDHVYRLKDTSGDGVADESQRLVADFNDEVADAAGAVLKHGNDLFVGVGPDMWRFSDKDGDGLPDDKKSISHGYGIHIGFSGHGMSGAEVGPDGRIYWQIGDIGFNGTGPDGKKWDHSNSGVIVRSEPDGSDFEVFAYGNRNTHEFVFDEYGNMISEDNDGDHSGERERIVYIVNGADFGWRINWQFGKYRDKDNNRYKVWMDEQLHIPRFPGQAAYIIPPIANFVNGPTGMLYNPGTALSDEYKNTFFIVEFVGNPARSGIHSFKLNPKGASFELGETKKVLGGVLATGIDFGPDGAMYVADWIDGWGLKQSGRIWKLDVTAPDAAKRKTTQELLGANFADYKVAQLGGILSNEDMRVRQKAQFELASRGEDGLNEFKEILSKSTNQLARIHSIWGISQLSRKEISRAKVLVPFLKDADGEIRAQAARWIGDVRYKEAGANLIPLLKDENSRARFFAAEALGRTAYEPAINPLVELLVANNDEDLYLRHAASLALARIGKPEPVVALSSHGSAAVRMGAVLALRRMANPGIRNFLNDANEYIVTEAARAINDDLSIPDALPALADILNTTPFKNEALIRRSINANLRVGTPKAIQNLVSYAAGNNNTAAMRREAIETLSTWPHPSVVDRVDGRYRGEFKRDTSAVRTASEATLINLSKDKETEVRLASVKAIAKLKVANARPQMLTVLRSDKDGEVRAEALKSYIAISGSQDVSEAVKVALADNAMPVRLTALDLLPKMHLADDLIVSLLLNVIETRSVEERQVALLTLSSVPVSASGKAFDKVLALYESRKLPVSVYLELADAIDSTKSETLIKKYKSIKVSSSEQDTLLASYAGAMSGGNAHRGERIFYQHETAQCIRCHSLGDTGGSAGPRLNGVANRLTPQQRLEALVNPSARLAPGFGTVTLTLKKGNTVSGILAAETSSSLTIKRGNQPDTVVQKSAVTNRVNAASSMPPMNYLLTKKEIRDIMSFLETLKEDE